MGEAKEFLPVKFICGVMSSETSLFSESEKALIKWYGPIDFSSRSIAFDQTDYYEKQMGKGLKRKFISFEKLIDPVDLCQIKHTTNSLEEEIQKKYEISRRLVNLDPGYLRPSALVMATVKDFAHRIPLGKGIYAHLELLFGKNDIRTLDWTYPDLKVDGHHLFFLEVRRKYLRQLRETRK